MWSGLWLGYNWGSRQTVSMENSAGWPCTVIVPSRSSGTRRGEGKEEGEQC